MGTQWKLNEKLLGRCRAGRRVSQDRPATQTSTTQRHLQVLGPSLVLAEQANLVQASASNRLPPLPSRPLLRCTSPPLCSEWTGMPISLHQPVLPCAIHDIADAVPISLCDRT